MSENIKLYTCPNCNANGVLPTEGMLCPNCKSNLKGEGSLSEVTSKEFFISEVKHTCVKGWETSIGELECSQEGLRFLPLVTYKESLTGFIPFVGILIGVAFFLLATGNVPGAVVAFGIWLILLVGIITVNTYMGNIYLKEYKNLSSQTELKVKLKQIVDIPKSSIKKVKKRGRNMIIVRNPAKGTSSETTFRLTDTAWKENENYLLQLSR